jgi:glycosyltransferase involved in cell wall biosynthesis
MVNIDISVIIPIYNVATHIDKCINSIQIQSGVNFEIILVNDGSTDDSLSIINKIKDDRIVIINKENTGVSDCRNIGINNARGKYVCFIDGDDYIESDYFKIAIEYMNTGIDLLIFDYFINTMDKNQKMLKIEEKKLPLFDLQNTVSILSNMGYVWNKIYKLEILKLYQISFNSKIALYEDVIFNAKYFKISKSIKNIPISYYHYLNRPTSSLIKSYNSNGLFCTIEMNKSIEFFLLNNKLEDKNINQIVSDNCMLGMKHQINTLFKFHQISSLNQLNELKKLISDRYIVDKIKLFNPISLSDKVYKYCILNSKAVLLFIICKIIK